MLDVLFWELNASPATWTSFMEAGVSKLQFLKKKNQIFPAVNFLSIFDNQNLKTLNLKCWVRIRNIESKHVKFDTFYV